MKKIPLLAIVILLTGAILLARDTKPGNSHAPAATDDGIAVYFSPKGGCEAAAVAEIVRARQTIDMQAYSFTNQAIGSALADAQTRGVKVRAILDSKAAKEERREPDFIAAHGIATFTDSKHPIAHNKIIIIDQQTVITGSFNFTEQAENSNAENMLIITGKSKLAAAYEKNFNEHLGHSDLYQGVVSK